MKKIILSLMLVAATLNAASITNTVDHIVNVRGSDAPIISQSFITASNMFLFGVGTSPTSVVAYSQLTNAVVSVSTNALTTASLDPVVNGQIVANGIKQSTIFWGTFLSPAAGGVCETEFWVMDGATTNKFAAGYFSVPLAGLLYTGKSPGSAAVPPGANFMWTNLQTSGTHYVTNSFKVF